MQDQPSFTVLDSFMMLIVVFLLACFAPGIFFPQMTQGSKPSSEEGSGPRPAGAGEQNRDTEQGRPKSEKGTNQEPSSEPEA